MSEHNSYKNFVLFLVGNLILVLGIFLVLIWWNDVVALFRGAAGMILALIGMAVLYILSQKKSV